MTRLFVGNNTRQNQILHFRLPEMPEGSRAYGLPIPMGGQVEVPHDLTQRDIDYLLHQWRHFGIMDSASVARAPGFIGFTYRVEKPIGEGSLQQGVEKTVAAEAKRSDQVFAESGVALADVIAKRAAEEGNTLNKVSISAQEDFIGTKPKGVVAKGIQVTPRGARAN